MAAKPKLTLPTNTSSVKKGEITLFVVLDDDVVLWRVVVEGAVIPQSNFKFVGPYWATTIKDAVVHGTLDVSLLIQATTSGSRGGCRVFWNSGQLAPDVTAVTAGGTGSGSQSYIV